jgi:hypothetical protein
MKTFGIISICSPGEPEVQHSVRPWNSSSNKTVGELVEDSGYSKPREGTVPISLVDADGNYIRQVSEDEKLGEMLEEGINGSIVGPVAYLERGRTKRRCR